MKTVMKAVATLMLSTLFLFSMGGGNNSPNTKNNKQKIEDSQLSREIMEDMEMMEITKQDESKPQPVEAPQRTTQLEIVDDAVE